MMYATRATARQNEREAPNGAHLGERTRAGSGVLVGSAGFAQRYLGNAHMQAASGSNRKSSATEDSAGCQGRSRTAGGRLVKVELEPHRGSESALRAMRPIYQQGKTPFIDVSGTVRASATPPADVATTGRHLGEIRHRYGDGGVRQSLRGLRLTRGEDFASAALRHMTGPRPAVRASGEGAASVSDEADQERAGSAIERLVESAGAGRPLPESSRRPLAEATGDDLRDVQVHSGSKADAAARVLGARAFTIGRSIYFGSGEYSPSTGAGAHLLAHEVAHAVQQAGAAVPRLRDLKVSTPGSSEEVEADRFADSTSTAHPRIKAPAIERCARVACVHRAISFSRTNDTFTTNNMDKQEDAALGFRFRRDVVPLFEWRADVTINGNPGDPCHNYEVGPHQVARAFWRNVYWGTGANRTRRRFFIDGGLPMRDATAAANTWYHDPYARAFTACGETQNTGLDDSPQSAWHPWNNPVPGRVGDRGWFNYGFAFVAYISARDITRGTGADAFQHLGHVYWNFGIAGDFDASRPLGSRVNITTGGPVNRSRVFSGGSGEFPSMHGGDIVNDNFNSVTT